MEAARPRYTGPHAYTGNLDMSGPGGRDELAAALDYILNRAGDAEFEVLAKAFERRRSDMTRFARLGGHSPDRAARDMAGAIQEQVGASANSIRGMVRGFVAELIRKDAPEIPEADLEALLSEWVPDPAARRERVARAKRELPADAVVAMLRDFIDFSEGRMLPSRQKELWDMDPRWQDSYFEAFPPELSAFLKARLARAMDDETFWTAVLSVLGL